MTEQSPPAAMTADDVEEIRREEAYAGYFRIDRYRLRHRLYDGGWGPTFEREVFERGHAVGVVLYDPERDLLVLIEQFRVGAFVAGREPSMAGAFSPWLIEIVAGIIDGDETPEAVARREAVEEAGCEISHLERIGVILTSPGGTSETVELYFGLTRAPQSGVIHGLDDEHEDIRVLVASPEDVWRWIDQGRIVNGPALVGLQWFRVHEKRLRNKVGWR